MSYKCMKCGTVRHGSELKKVTEIRDVDYNRVFLRFDRREKKNIENYDTTFYGTEIVTEQKLCDECYELVKDVIPRVNRKPKSVNFVGMRKKPKESSGEDSKGFDNGEMRDKFER